MVKCITGTRMTMWADVLRQGEHTADDIPLSEQGTHVVVQNPRTGQLERKWVPVVDDSDPLAPVTFSIPCSVQAIIDGGIRVAGTTERFEKTYNNVDIVKMTFPAYYKGKRLILTKRDRITNVRLPGSNEIIWVEEELDATDGIYPATIFDVLGVSPLVAPLVGHTENFAMLARADLNGES